MTYSVAAKADVQFRVKACSSAFIILDDLLSGESVYEIEIGGSNNQMTSIRNKRNVNPVAEIETPDILSCDEHRPFWISWLNFRVSVGHGYYPGVRSIISWQDGSPTGVSDLKIATGNDVTGDWVFAEIKGS